MEEEKKAIERAKEILKEWQEIVDIEDTVEREIEMTLYAEDMPFNELKILVNLVEQLEKENKELTENYNELENAYITDNIPKFVIRDKIEELEKNENCTYCNNTCNKYLACKCLKEILGE